MNDKKQISAFEADWRKAAWVKSVRQRREQAERRGHDRDATEIENATRKLRGVDRVEAHHKQPAAAIEHCRGEPARAGRETHLGESSGEIGRAIVSLWHALMAYQSVAVAWRATRTGTRLAIDSGWSIVEGGLISSPRHGDTVVPSGLER